MRPTTATNFAGTGFFRILITLLPVLLLATGASAHNGRLALGLPAEGIVVDGDLSDWPQDMPRYSITMAEAGKPPTNPQDFTADFRVAYSVEANLLYVAVDVEDESIVLDPEGVDAFWDNADGCDVFVGLQHGNLGGGVVQMALWGHNLNSFPNDMRDAYKVIVRQRPRGRVYEWSVDVSRLSNGRTLHEGMDFAFDVVVSDKDEDGSFSWMAWGARSEKLASPLRLGDVMLVAADANFEDAVASAGEMIQRTSRRSREEVRNRTGLLALTSGSLIAVSLLHLMLFWFQRETRTNLYYAINTACTAAAIFASFHIPVVSGIEVLTQISSSFSLGAVGASMAGFVLLVYGSSLLFLYAFFYERMPKFGRGILILMVAVPASGLLALLVNLIGDPTKGLPAGTFFYAIATFILPLLIVSMFVEIPRIVLAAVLRRKPGAWSVGVGFLIFAVCGVILIFRLASRDPIEAWLLLGIVLPLGTMSFRLARSVATVHRDLAERYREVEALSQQLGDRNRALEMANIQISEQSVRVAEADRLKSDFLARMSHDLRTPLNAIIGYTRILLRRVKDDLEPRQYRNLENVRVSADNLLTLINDILDLSRIESGRSEMQIDDVELPSLIATCSASLESLVGDDVTFSTRVGSQLPIIRSDEDRVRRVLMNLSGNAIKYTEAGTITISADRVGDEILLQVADTGLGIPAQDLPHIFDEFRQVDRRDRKREGSGLGLAIARKSVEMLGGRIEVESQVGVGSTFSVFLPLQPPHTEDAAETDLDA